MQKLETIIKELIINEKIKTQNELTKILSKLGHNTTQSNISRILKKLGTIKQVDEENPKSTYYSIQQKPLEISTWVKSLVKNILNNDLEIIIHTRDGAASVIAKIIDEKNHSEILGTIAGTDTVLVITKGREHCNTVLQKLKDMFLATNNQNK